MAGRDYPRLDIKTFGDHLLTSGDLDPLYIALHKAELPRHQLGRFLMAYWCLYHVGLAAWLADHKGADFFAKLHEAAANTTPSPLGERWPRGSERRHWRGQQAIRSAYELEASYAADPQAMMLYCATGHTSGMGLALRPQTFEEVAQRVRRHRGFGDWISFKVADMLDRLDIVKVDFDQAAVFMFDDPRKAALRVWREAQKLPEGAKPKDEAWAIGLVVDHLTEQFKGHTAPPLHDRPVGLQEVETVLCKWKSHQNGHYPLNNDIDEISHGLEPWSKVSPTAALLLGCMPKRL